MKRILLTVCALVVLWGMTMPLTTTAQTSTKSKYEFEMYHIVLVREGPNWESQNSEEGMEVRMNVIAGLQKASEAGILVSAGLVNDASDVEFILILRIETLTETQALLNKSRHIKDGFFKAETYSWFAPKGLEPGPPREK
jgi:hypothetical protein